MTRKFNLQTAGGIRGLFLVLFICACSDTSPTNGALSTGGSGGTGGSAETAGSAGSTLSAGAHNANAGDPGDTSDAGGAGEPESAGSAGAHASSAGKGGTGGTAGNPSAGGTDANGGKAGHAAAGAGGGAAVLMIPCDVHAAYQVCRNCHTDPPLDGAPMPLLTLTELQVYTDSTYKAIVNGSMPAAGTLSESDAQLILDWLDAGAKGVPQAQCP